MYSNELVEVIDGVATSHHTGTVSINCFALLVTCASVSAETRRDGKHIQRRQQFNHHRRCYNGDYIRSFRQRCLAVPPTSMAIIFNHQPHLCP